MIKAIRSDNLNSFKRSVDMTVLSAAQSVNEQYDVLYEIIMHTSEPFTFINYWKSRTPHIGINQLSNFVSEEHGLLLTRMTHNNASLDRLILAVVNLNCNPFNSDYGDIAPIFYIYNAGHAKDVLTQMMNPNDVRFNLTNTKIHQTGRTLMHHAALQGDVDFVTFLVNTYNVDKNLEYFNADKQRFDSIVDCFYECNNASNIIPVLFEQGLYDPNNTYEMDDSMTYFTRACEIPDLDVSWFLNNMNRIDLSRPEIPACLVAVKNGRKKLAAELVVKYGDYLFTPDNNNLCAFYYMMADFDPVYYTILDLMKDVNTQIVDFTHQLTAMHVVALKCSVDVLKYVVGKDWYKPYDLLTVCLSNLLTDDELTFESTLTKAMYLVHTLKYDALRSNDAQLFTDMDVILAVFLHFVHRAAPVYLPLPAIDRHEDVERDRTLMYAFYEAHDQLPNPDRSDIVANENTARITLALDYAYDILPIDYRLKPYDVRLNLSDQDYVRYIEMCKMIKSKILQLIHTCMEMTQFKVSPEIQTFFHPYSRLYELFNNTAVSSLARLAKHSLL
ncbi:hypothetical protein ECIV_ORF39 [European chub iridovirus]|nr:hypothetical protein ECIV_ORF39 [European chub iridovirus]